MADGKKRWIIPIILIVASLLCTLPGRAQQDDPPAAAPPKATKPAPATPLDKKKIEFGWPKIWQPDWDMIVENALPTSLLSEQVPRDVRRFCPRFYQMNEADKRAYWAYFFQALAAAEAGLNPTSHVRHPVPASYATDEVTHQHVRCEGLLQLTYADARRYGCNFDWDADRDLKPADPARTILQPENNLACGVKILTHQLIDKHEPLFTRRSYWATLQPGTASFHAFARQMTNPPIACRLVSRAHKSSEREMAER